MDNDQATLSGQNEAEVEVEKTTTEIMAETLAGIRGRNAEPAETGHESTETAPQKQERAREKDGKFAKNEAATASKDVQPSAGALDKSSKIPVVESAAGDQAATNNPGTVPAAVHAAIQPPNGLTAEGKAEFVKASPALQREIVKRENDFHNYYHKEVAPLKQAAQYGQEIYKALQPYEQTIRNWNATPAQAIQALFAADHKLTHGAPHEKLQAFAELAKGYGIDLSQGLPAQQQLDPNVEYLQRQNQQAIQAAQQAHQRIQQMEARQEQERVANERAQLNSELERIKQGKPHFEELSQSIGLIMQAAIGRNETMTWDQAYESALWQSPQHRAELLAKQQADAAAAAAQKRADEASKAKAAKAASSTNVAKRGSLQTQGAIGDSQDFIREELSRMRTAR